MDRLIYTAMTGASQTMMRQAAVSHNLANANTDGYRSFEHRLRAVQVNAQGPQARTVLPTRAFVTDSSEYTDYRSGPMRQTQRPLDLAVQGRGFFAVAMPDGSEAYTRAGSFTIGADGTLQTPRGLQVLGDGGPITIPAEGSVLVGEDGTVTATPDAGAGSAVLGRLKLVAPDESQLVRGEDGYFRLPEGEVAPAAPEVVVYAGFVESSNVSVAEQMVSMISLARQFEMQIKMLQNADANDKAGAQILAQR